jgi:hypothetical protein
MPHVWLLALTGLLLPAGARADFELPKEGQPEDFSGVVGAYRIEARAELPAQPAAAASAAGLGASPLGSGPVSAAAALLTDRPEPIELYAEDALTLTLCLTVADPQYHPDRLKLPAGYRPHRLNLRAFAPLTALFHVEDLPERDARPDKDSWEFSYRLRPRKPGVAKIPRLPFVYCKTVTGDPRSYETAYTDSIPVTVKPRPPANLIKDFAETGDRLAEQYPLRAGDAVLSEQAEDEVPGPAVWAVLLLGPPLLCWLWYKLWQRYYPDAVRAAGQRRSRAARAALKSLRRPGKGAPPDQAARVAAVVAGYLRQRLDLPVEELTPVETALHLEQAGVSAAAAGRFADLFRECDATRFSPDPPAGGDLAARAARLIRDLEEEPCFLQTLP